MISAPAVEARALGCAHLCRVTVDTKKRTVFVFADTIVSFTTVLKKSDPGNNAYTMELSNGSQITLHKKECDRIIASPLFRREKAKAATAGW
jgi:hypothetical protein